MKYDESNEAFYFDGEQTIAVTYTEMRTTAGRSVGPAYRVSYRLANGTGWLNGTRYTDRGDLMTGVHVSNRPSVSK